QVDELQEIQVLAPKVHLPFPLDVFAGLLPAGNGREGTRGRGPAAPVVRAAVDGCPPIENDRLTRRAIVEAPEGNATIWRPEVLTVCEVVSVGAQQIDGELTPLGDLDLLRVVRPVGGILNVVDVAPQPAETLEVVQHLPSHSCERRPAHNAQNHHRPPRWAHLGASTGCPPPRKRLLSTRSESRSRR